VTDALNLAGIKLGNYRLQRVLGRGNMGVVYLATDEALLRPTAVKVLAWSPTEQDPEAWFLAEARSVAQLNHPSVIQIYSVARHGPYCYIAMEYVEGVSADVLVTRDGPFSAERATEVILQLAAALELAHASGIIHRDVKPGNILIKKDGTAKLGDFGMAVSARGKKPTVRAGTPHYFAPEIWRGEPASIATDLYALGATYYYLLAGRPPLDGATIAGLSAAHQHQPVVAPPELAANVAATCMRVVRRCMAKSPVERYESARAVAWDSRGVLRELEAVWATPSNEMPARRVDAIPSALRTAVADWQDRGFLHEPFADIDPNAPPYRAAPFDGLRRELAARLEAPGTTLVLAGAPHSGRSTLARWTFAANAQGGAYLDLALASTRPGSLARRIARVFGGGASASAGASADLEGLLEALADTRPGEPARLIVVDGVVPGTRAAADVAVLARAARSTRYFSLLAIGPAELAADLIGPNPAGSMVTLSPLTLPQVRGYLASWLVATRRSDAPPLILSVDAALLIGHRAEGNLGRINALAREMLMCGGPIYTSWDAWSAPDGIGHRAGDREMPPVRPPSWPTPEIVRLINQCRIAAGHAERGSND
jgi:protein kinase-like protein